MNKFLKVLTETAYITLPSIRVHTTDCIMHKHTAKPLEVGGVDKKTGKLRVVTLN